MELYPLTAEAVPPRGRTAWLAGVLRGAVLDGRLPPGAAVPPTRSLAVELGVSRGVVVAAYQRLVDEGLLAARVGAGTVVATRPEPSGTPRAAAAQPLGALPVPMPTDAHIEFDLSPGIPDLSAFPRSAWLRAERAVLATAAPSEFGYGDPRGNPALRDELAGWLARSRGVRADPERMIITSGVAQALAVLIQTLCARGVTRVAVEDPGSRGTRTELTHWGVEPVPVAVDDRGLDVAALAATGLSAVLTTPAHQYPVGVVLAPERRRALLDWGGLIIEDDYDAEHRYDRAPVSALQASAPDRVAYTGSTSKTLAPGLRIGWLLAPAHLQRDLLAAKYASDIAGPALPQLVLARLLATGELDRHLRAVRSRQRARRDALLTALRERLPALRVHGVAAGLHLLVTLPGAQSDLDLHRDLLGRGVLVHPLSWHRMRPGPPGFVLGYAALTPDRLRAAAGRIADVLHPARTRRRA